MDGFRSSSACHSQREMAMLNPSAKLTLCFKVLLLSPFLQVKKPKSGRKFYVNTYSGNKKIP